MLKPWIGAPVAVGREHGEIMWLNVDSMVGDVGIT
jgi:hypothetical protein